jgi:hypothetical protein
MPPGINEGLQDHVAIAILIPLALQWLKAQPWFPFMNYKGGSLNRVVSWTIAALTGIGIGFDYNSALGSLTITGLTVAGILGGIHHAVIQLAMNHAAYKTIVAPPPSGEVQDAERKGAKAVTFSFVGTPLAPGSKMCSVLPGDATKVGDKDPSGKYTKRTPDIYEQTG